MLIITVFVGNIWLRAELLTFTSWSFGSSPVGWRAAAEEQVAARRV